MYRSDEDDRVKMKKSLRTKLGQYVVMSGLVKLRDVNRCLREQKRLREKGENRPLGEILVREKLITTEQLKEALAAIGALVAYCPRCRWRKQATRYVQGKKDLCARCRSPLQYGDASVLENMRSETAAMKAPDPKGKDTTITKDPEKDPLINRIIGGCQILERVARGGMGVVYKAKQLNLGRTVAVKILPEELANDGLFVRRFIHEARAAAELNHGNIVHINDVGQQEGIFFFTMEFVDGANLSQILRQRTRLELLEATEIAYQVCQALRHAHRKNIIHRDISPQNILAVLADSFFALDTGNFFCCPIKRRNPPIQVNRENTFAYRVQNNILFFIFHFLL